MSVFHFFQEGGVKRAVYGICAHYHCIFKYAQVQPFINILPADFHVAFTIPIIRLIL